MAFAPVLYPSEKEFKDFRKYVQSLCESIKDVGIVKIVPPKGWAANDSGYNIDGLIIESPIVQSVSGSMGAYRQLNIEDEPISVKEFASLSDEEEKKFRVKGLEPEDVERVYWRNVSLSSPKYGADIPGTLFDEDVEHWNLNNLDNILNVLGVDMPGINKPYLYWGMWKSSFAWHIEDMELYSINYNHFGKPKEWYGIAEKDAHKFEDLAKFLFPHEHRICKQFLRHKQTIINPRMLKSHNIPYHRVIQSEGEFVITFPKSYHGGFNHGFNCAEAVNFAFSNWIPFGIFSKPCFCDSERAIIHMESFLNQCAESNVLPKEEIDFYSSCCKYRNGEYDAIKEYPKFIMKIKTRKENGKKRKVVETRTIPTDLSQLNLIRNV